MYEQGGRGRTVWVRGALWALLLVALGWPQPAGASAVRALSVEQQVALSDAVVEGIVGVAEPKQGPGGRPFTDSPIHVSKVLHARAAVPEVVWVRQRRGVVGGRRVSVVGDAVLKPGDHVVAFLRFVKGRWYLTSLAQSVFWLDDSRTPVAAEQRLTGLLRVGDTGRPVPSPGPGAHTSAEALRRAVRAAGVQP